ncbi:MAG: transglycosylase SLT domain-containing protein [Serratia proteamaculans]
MKVEELVYLVKLNSEAFLKGKAKVDLELASMEKSADGAADAVEGVGDAAADAGDKLEGAGKKAGDAGKDFKGAGDDAKKAGDGFEESGEQAEGAGEKVEGAGKKSEKTGKKTDKLGLSLKKTGKDAAKFGKTTAQSFSKVAKYALGFFGVALTLEGARRFFVGTTDDVLALSNAAAFLDMPIKQLDGLSKAAQAGGASVADLQGVMMRMQNTVNSRKTPVFGMDGYTQLLAHLDATTGNKFQITAQKNAKGMLIATAKALRSMPKSAAELFAGQLGISTDLFDTMMKPDFEKSIDHYTKNSGQTDEAAKRAREIKKTLTDIQTTAEGVGNAIYVAFGPAIDDGLKEFDKLLQEFGDYIVEHKDDIIGFFKDSATEAGKFADAVGGTSNALKILLGTYIAAKSVGVFGAASRGGIGLLNPTVAGGIAYADWLSDKKNRDDSIDSAKSSWGNTKGTIGDLMRSVGISTNFGRDPNEVRSNAAVTADIPGYSQPVQHAQAARRKRPLGALLSPLLQNHNAMLEKRYQLPPGTLSALAMTESSGNPMAISKAGAMGMYQIMPKTGKAYGMSAADFFDPIAESNVTARILSENLKHYHGNLQLALAAYNAGVGRLDGALAGHGAPLTDETLNYPGKVLSYMDEYRNYHANTGAAMAPGAIDNSQTAATHINAVHVTSNPATVDELTNSINEQSRRSQLTGAFMGGVN